MESLCLSLMYVCLWLIHSSSRCSFLPINIQFVSSKIASCIKKSRVRIERIDTLQQEFVVAQKHDLCSDGGIDCARLLTNYTTKAWPHAFRRSRSRRYRKKPTREQSEEWEFRLQHLPLNVGLWLGSVPWQKRSIMTEPVCQFPLHIPFFLGFFLLFHVHGTIHVDSMCRGSSCWCSRRLTVLDTPSFVLRLLLVLYIRMWMIVLIARRCCIWKKGRHCSRSCWWSWLLQFFFFLLQVLQLGENIAIERNKNRQQAFVRKELRHILPKKSFHYVPLISCEFHCTMYTPPESQTTETYWIIADQRRKRKASTLGPAVSSKHATHWKAIVPK